MSESPSQGGSPFGDLTGATRDLTERFQALAERIQKTGQAGLDTTMGLGMSGVVKPWLSLMEAATSQTAVPILQLQTVIDGIRAQREQVKVLQSQLMVFDKQLATMESSLQPLLSWSQQWVGVQESVLGRIRDLIQPGR
jgi:hypothetical protein